MLKTTYSYLRAASASSTTIDIRWSFILFPRANVLRLASTIGEREITW
jgi:hypothetical protein